MKIESSWDECEVDIYIRPRFGYVEFVEAKAVALKKMTRVRKTVGQKERLDSTMARKARL